MMSATEGSEASGINEVNKPLRQQKDRGNATQSCESHCRTPKALYSLPTGRAGTQCVARLGKQCGQVHAVPCLDAILWLLCLLDATRWLAAGAATATAAAAPAGATATSAQCSKEGRVHAKWSERSAEPSNGRACETNTDLYSIVLGGQGEAGWALKALKTLNTL